MTIRRQYGGAAGIPGHVPPAGRQFRGLSGLRHAQVVQNLIGLRQHPAYSARGLLDLVGDEFECDGLSFLVDVARQPERRSPYQKQQATEGDQTRVTAMREGGRHAQGLARECLCWMGHASCLNSPGLDAGQALERGGHDGVVSGHSGVRVITDITRWIWRLLPA